MKIPFIDLKRQYNNISSQIDEVIKNVIDSTAFASGPYVEKFEEFYRNYIGVKHCIGVNSGTSALHLSLKVLNVGNGDEVITTPHTFVSTVWAISYVGAKPVFVDINPDTYTIDVDKIQEKITDKTKVIMPVHLYGQSANTPDIVKLARENHLFVIEDAAQAQGSECNGNKCGSLADIGCFSFYPGKNLGAFGEAGAITTDDDNLANELRYYRNHCQKEKNLHFDIGYNYRMDGIQGAVLSVKLKYLDLWNQQRKEIADNYSEAFKELDDIKIPFELPNVKHIYHQYQLQLKDENTRNSLREYLTKEGIASGLHYPVPVHLQQAYAHLGYKEGDFPETEKAAKCNISLPIFPEMTEEETNYVIEKIKEYFKR